MNANFAIKLPEINSLSVRALLNTLFLHLQILIIL